MAAPDDTRDPSNDASDGASGDKVSLRIAAPPDRIYELITDIAGMGRLSPECTGGTWLDGATGPTVGARFKGTNRRGFARWSTVSTVVAADPGNRFAFETKQSGFRWTYELVADPDLDGTTATIVTESRAAFTDRPLVARIYTKVALGGVEEHDQEMRDGMRRTLERLRDIAEGSAVS